METREAVMAKIAKLLRLGGSPNAHEAALAMEKAQELALRYGLAVESCRDADVEDVEEERVRAPHMTDEERIVSGLIDRHFAVRVLEEPRSGFSFFGDRLNVAVARHAFLFLVAEVRRGMDALALYSPDRRKTYALGFAGAVDEKLEAAPIRNDAGIMAMVLASRARIDAAIARRYAVKESAAPRRRMANDAGLLAAGWQHGERTDVRRPLEAAGVGPKALTK